MSGKQDAHSLSLGDPLWKKRFLKIIPLSLCCSCTQNDKCHLPSYWFLLCYAAGANRYVARRHYFGKVEGTFTFWAKSNWINNLLYYYYFYLFTFFFFFSFLLLQFGFSVVIQFVEHSLLQSSENRKRKVEVFFLQAQSFVLLLERNGAFLICVNFPLSVIFTGFWANWKHKCLTLWQMKTHNEPSPPSLRADCPLDPQAIEHVAVFTVS